MALRLVCSLLGQVILLDSPAARRYWRRLFSAFPYTAQWPTLSFKPMTMRPWPSTTLHVHCRQNVILLIDTYDTEAAAEKVVRLAPTLARDGIKVKGVRLDSGDLAEHAFKVRRILDDGGLKEVTIFASGSVDEYVLEKLMQQGAPIDGFGIGTHMDTSADAPYLDCAYKLVEYAGKARRKRSEGKGALAGAKTGVSLLR